MLVLNLNVILISISLVHITADCSEHLHNATKINNPTRYCSAVLYVTQLNLEVRIPVQKSKEQTI